MADWKTRKSLGDQHELRVLTELQRHGWTVHPCGQGTYPAAIQRALRACDSALRQFPDMIAARGPDVVVIDAKTRSRPHTGRYAISRTCVRAGLQFVGANAPIPLYYVLGDISDNLTVLTPAEISAYTKTGHLHPSGAYYLIEARHAHPFEAVFGTTPQAMTA
ncbi:hypothetical protein [Actinomadura sp. 21ATH]|uniref:hypothetical protein n=1 Tax=Actinomadura sp. 21ATH TaxID=1735444 RepID=UPI0035C145ED